MLWRYAILTGCLTAIAVIMYAWPYASDRGRRFVPFGVAVMSSWAFFYSLLLWGWPADSLPIIFMARFSMTLTIALAISGARAMKAEGIEKRATAGRVLRQEAIIDEVRDKLHDEIGDD